MITGAISDPSFSPCPLWIGEVAHVISCAEWSCFVLFCFFGWSSGWVRVLPSLAAPPDVWHPLPAPPGQLPEQRWTQGEQQTYLKTGFSPRTGNMQLRLPRGFPPAGPECKWLVLPRAKGSPAPTLQLWVYGSQKLKASSVRIQTDPSNTGKFSLTDSSPMTMCLYGRLLSAIVVVRKPELFPFLWTQ